jgi:hypothetical protein
VDQRTMDRLVKTIVDELQQRDRSSPAGVGALSDGAGSDAVALVDNWRIRADNRQEFLEHYTTHVADVVRQIPGFVAGRVYASEEESSYSWHVQAYFEFESGEVVARFRKEYDRALRKVKPGLSMDKVLDAMSAWVLAHEDGVLFNVWR